jgi:hypothetical protein
LRVSRALEERAPRQARTERPPVVTPGGQPPVSRAQGWAALAIGGACFALALAGFHAVAAPGGGDILGSKLQHYEAAAGRYDTVFLGSSHVYRGFVPARFDAELAAHGLACHSFNLGIQYPHQLELEYLFRALLASGAGRLRRVLVEYVPLTPQIDPANAFQARAVHWHDLPATALALERILALERAEPGPIPLVPDPENPHSILGLVEQCLPSAWTLTRVHVQHAFKRAFLVDRWTDVLKGLGGRAHGQCAEWARTQGFLALEEDEARLAARGRGENSFTQRRAAFQADLEAFQRDVEVLRTQASAFGDEEWMEAGLRQVHDLSAYHRMASAARAKGVELVVVVMPSLSCERLLEERLGAELGVPVLRFNQPDEFPALYDPALRFDSGHLSADGAQAFSTLLALAWLRRGEAP